MPGYANRVIRFDFPDLSEDPENDPVWVVFRNPKLLPTEELASAYDGGTGYDVQAKKVTDPEAFKGSANKIIAKLVIAARAYDATTEPVIDPLTGEITGNADQELLPPPPWTPQVAAKLAGAIRQKIVETVGEAINPQPGSESRTQKMSSSSPNPSTTAPGVETQSQPS